MQLGVGSDGGGLGEDLGRERVGAVVLAGWVRRPRLPGPLEAAPRQIARDPAETTRRTPLNLGFSCLFCPLALDFDTETGLARWRA
jgi:hypothetical protein